jgi:hypothetical protein
MCALPPTTNHQSPTTAYVHTTITHHNHPTTQPPNHPKSTGGGAAGGSSSPAKAKTKAADSGKPVKKSGSGGSGGGAAVPDSDKVWEFDKANLVMGAKLGEGMFGEVYAGVAKGLVAGEAQTQVAIKTLASTEKEVEKEFHQEAEIMMSLDGSFATTHRLATCPHLASPSPLPGFHWGGRPEILHIIGGLPISWLQLEAPF